MDVIMEEEVGPIYLYQGGSVEGTRCLWCKTSSTSGSWRRGWRSGQNDVNLCNKCGQKWVKLGKPSSYEATIEADKRKAAGERITPAPSTRTPAREGVTNKRPLQGGLTLVSRDPQRRRMLSDATTESFEPDNIDTTDGDVSLNLMSLEGSLPSYPRKSKYALPVPSTGRFVSYAFQKWCTGEANHALFWVQDDAANSVLAIVGTDTCKSGHFRYKSVPEFHLFFYPQPIPLSSTNRTEASNWLATLDIKTCINEENLQLPALTTDELKAAVMQGASLIGAPSSTRIQQQEKAGFQRSPSRLLGAKIKPGSMTNLTMPLPINTTSGAAVVEQQPVHGFGGVLNRLPLQLKCNACGGSDHAIDECNFSCISPPALVENTDAATFKMLFDDPFFQFDSDLEFENGSRNGLLDFPAPLDVKANVQQQLHANTTAFVATNSGSTHFSLDGGASSPGALSRPAHLHHHHHPTINYIGPVQPSVMVSTVSHASPSDLVPLPRTDTAVGHHMALRPQVVTAPTTTAAPVVVVKKAAEDRHPQSSAPLNHLANLPKQPSGGGGGGVQQYVALEPAAHAAFSKQPQLLTWVSRLPSSAQEEAFKEWSRQLTGQINVHPPDVSRKNELMPLGGIRWTPVSEAMAILGYLATANVNMALLQRTSVCRAVAMLRTHQIPDIAEVAQSIVEKWRSMAETVLETATTALAAGGTVRV